MRQIPHLHGSALFTIPLKNVDIWKVFKSKKISSGKQKLEVLYWFIAWWL